jgi:hypothetical protein
MPSWLVPWLQRKISGSIPSRVQHAISTSNITTHGAVFCTAAAASLCLCAAEPKLLTSPAAESFTTLSSLLNVSD